MPITVYRSGDLYFVRFSLRVKPRRVAFVIGNFTAFMKSIELEFCGDDYCAYVALPPGRYLYRYLVDGEVVLDDGPVENGYNVLLLRGPSGGLGWVLRGVGCLGLSTGFSLIGLSAKGLVGLGIGLVVI
jgi:hypothetical protein